MSQSAANVTKLPNRNDAPREILHFADGFLESVYYGNEWRRLANFLESWKRNIPHSMHDFIRQMQARKERPTTNQLALMLGLMIQAQARERFNKWEAGGSGKAAEVVPIK